MLWLVPFLLVTGITGVVVLFELMAGDTDAEFMKQTYKVYALALVVVYCFSAFIKIVFVRG